MQKLDIYGSSAAPSEFLGSYQETKQTNIEALENAEKEEAITSWKMKLLV